MGDDQMTLNFQKQLLSHIENNFQVYLQQIKDTHEISSIIFKINKLSFLLQAKESYTFKMEHFSGSDIQKFHFTLKDEIIQKV